MKRASILKDNFLTICAILAGLILFGLVGAMDAEDAEKQEELYCEMVAAGHWPDYQRNAEEICRGKVPHAPDTGRLAPREGKGAGK